MAPIKLEENIREKLQERELQPSKGAWNTLQNRLDGEETKGGSKVMWYAIAASIAALLIIGALVFSPSEIESNEVIATENISEEAESQTNPETSPQEIPSEAIALEEDTSEATVSDKKVPTEIQQVQKKQQTKYKEDIAVNTPLKQKAEVANTAIEKQQGISFEDSKVEEVVAKLKEIQKTNQTITVGEVDALLAVAQREIQNQRILTAGTQKVDATALLLDVELELERSFRDKVFDVLGDGFQKIRTAVTERNN
ncbi:hypothetical protein ATE92_0509 [Ulvibacter sp. MAR_2010_11]|uniref:hypothetical protein n=1 Tax=Ulvibacter sp. MAR_2010_11 TaxID=1250229 RepID=UPI000C2C9B44|nr:hypothetical protein [Ulvibacter sp. MAR_2010_11]PKA82380.1 hypothetical protein ATE92_0509 [Ulvibacter sp. MAR_2010_11]